MSINEFDEDFAENRDWAKLYRSVGFQVVPAYRYGEDKKQPANYKRPVIAWREWENTLVPDSLFSRWYGQSGEHVNRTNMGLVTGAASGGLLCVDLDVKEGNTAMRWWESVLALHNHGLEPETVSQRTGGGGRQILFRAPAGYCPPTNKTTIGVDFRGQGGFMMCPPSVHESGRTYEWEAGRAPHETDVAEAPEWLIEEVEAVIEKHSGGGSGGPRERTASGADKNDFGRNIDGREEDARRIVWRAVVELYRDSPIPPSQSIQEEAFAAAFQRYLTDNKTRLSPRDGLDNAALLDLEGRGITDFRRKWHYAMKKWDKEVRAAAETPLAEPEKKPFVESVEGQEVSVTTVETQADMRGSSIFDPWHQFVVPSFPMDTLPPHLRRFVDYLSTSTGGDPSACAMAALACCSGALDQEFSLKMKRTGDWYVRPRLWVMLVGSPSTKKTPIVSSCIRPIRSWESVGVKQYQKDFGRWKDDKDGGVKGEPEPKKPTRYLLNQVTSEKLGEILSRQDRGIMVEQDEISGWIGAMEKYGGKGASADRGFWLSAFNGGPVTVDRLGRGETFVNNLAVAFVGGVQPDRLMELGNLASDGLLQRFLPVMMQKAVYSSEVESDTPKKDYETLIHELIKAKACGLIMDAAALKATDEFQKYLFDLEGMDGLGKNFCSFAGKLSGLHGSLSMVLHMIDDPENATIEPVSEATVRNAERIITEFCIPHALEFYRGTGDGADWDYLRKIASFILTSDKDRFTVSDFTSGVHSLRGMGVWDVTQKLSPLVAGGWLVEDETSKTVRSWGIVEGLREALSERRKEESKRKEEVISQLNALKRGSGRK
jgi:Protein of unknown function (DUF3987)/Bifunctional DNA primase/polymerase, N-terminal